MKYFTGIIEILNSNNELVNSLPVQALAKRSRFKSGTWKYTVRIGLAYDLADCENKSVIFYTESEWADAVKAAISKEAEHENVRFFLFREIVI